MKKFHITLLALSIAFSGVKAQQGTIDLTYGTNGVLYLDPAGSLIGQTDNANDVVALQDGSSYVCGASKIDNVMNGTLYHILANGTQDMTFGTGGMTTMIYGLETYAYDMAVQPDGKIVVSGIVYPDYNVNLMEIFAARFNPDGTPDLTFNGTGKFISTYSLFDDDCETMAIQPDGKIVLAGSTKASQFDDTFFCRLNSNGTLDNTFGINGYVQYSVWDRYDYIKSIAILSNGDIVGAGFFATYGITEKAFVLKLNSAGNVVFSFGNDGVVIPYAQTTHFSGIAAKGNYMYLTGDIYPGQYDFITCKMDLDGIMDETFGNFGSATLNINNNTSEFGMDIKIQPDNKIVISGQTGESGIGAPADIALIRYTTDGQLDPSFGTGGTGYTVTSLGPLWEEGKNFDFQPDGKILVCGMTNQAYNIEGYVARYQGFTVPAINLNLKAFFEGPFNGSSMNTSLNTSLPLSQPYSGAPWNYGGTEQVTSIPNANIVDWVLVELRQTTGDASTATPDKMIARQAGFILSDGTIKATNGNSNMNFIVSVTANLYVVIWHRNHLSIMSAGALTGVGGVYTYNFTTGATKTYGGQFGCKQLSTTQWGMIGGNGNGNRNLDNSDKNDVWILQNGTSGYKTGDFNMNGTVDGVDKSAIWAPNTGKSSQVPH